MIGNPNAPWINQTAQQYGLATNYFGVTHPSQPNYIAATSGSTNGVTDDNDITINVPNIVDQLEAHGKTWKAYMQSFALCATKLDHACGNQLYERKHNPFVSYLDVQINPARMANIVDSQPARYRPGRQHRARLRLDQPGPVPRHARTRGDACRSVRLLAGAVV